PLCSAEKGRVFMRKAVLLVALMAGMATLTGVLGTGKALAYGPGAVAQLEVSGNCTNVTFCNANFGGTGGLWIWAALQSDHTADATFAGCGHTVGGGGPGSGGGRGGHPARPREAAHKPTHE